MCARYIRNRRMNENSESARDSNVKIELKRILKAREVPCSNGHNS